MYMYVNQGIVGEGMLWPSWYDMFSGGRLAVLFIIKLFKDSAGDDVKSRSQLAYLFDVTKPCM